MNQREALEFVRHAPDGTTLPPLTSEAFIVSLAVREVARRQDLILEVLGFMLTDEVPPEGNGAYRAMLREKLDMARNG